MASSLTGFKKARIKVKLTAIIFFKYFYTSINTPMRRLFSVLILLFIFSATQAQQKATSNNAAAAESGYAIPVTVTPFKNTKIYLGCYYGKYKNLVDSIILDDKSNGVFKGKEKLHQGIYFLVSSGKVIMFEFFMDADQHFSVKADSADYSNAAITGSKENALFHDYTVFLSKEVPQITSLQEKLKTAKTAADSAAIQSQLKKLNQDLTAYRENAIAAHPQSMLALFFTAIKRSDVPKNLTQQQAGYYMKEHYWDGVLFNDPRLLRTPFFDPKLQDYFKYYISPEPDSIIPEVNYMLLSARTEPDMFKYLLGNFTDKYINPEIMGQDKVFLFLFNNFYAKGDTLWLSATQRKYIFDRAYSLMANQIGGAAPVLDLVDTAGKTQSLYKVDAPFTIVVFWDPDCSHCQKELPVLDSMYNAKWKGEGVKIYSVNIADYKIDHWKKFINDNHLQDWVNVYQTHEQKITEEAQNLPNYRQLYDVFQTPTMYLLDKDKHIIAKRLSIDQFDGVITSKLKNSNPNIKE
jgi:thiol-disulfide isomerase/thioredoxin